MDEYINRNELLKVIQSNVAEAHNERCAQLLEAILNAPTADVVPKSEVEKLVQDGTRLGQENETLKDNNEHLAVMLEEAKSEVERLQEEAENLRNANADLALALLYECEPTKEHLSELEKAVRVKVASEIFAEVENNLSQITRPSSVTRMIAELKKKYTEGEYDRSRS